METWKGARFVGLYVCFPITNSSRRTQILTEILKLEESFSFDTVKFGLLSKGVRKSPFAEAQLPQFLKALEKGEADWLQLYPTPSNNDWVSTYEEQLHLTWSSGILESVRRPNWIETRFGNVGSMTVTYPISRFQTDSESSFQARLMHLAKRLTREQSLYWSFIHEGFRPKRPASVGEDDIFQETREKFPLTSFDMDLDVPYFFKEFVKGAFWANFLNPFHVQKLGGLRRIRADQPTSIIEDLGDNRVLLEVGPSPLPGNYEKAITDYQRLRAFLKPILLETPEDRATFQKEAVSSWGPGLA